MPQIELIEYLGFASVLFDCVICYVNLLELLDERIFKFPGLKRRVTEWESRKMKQSFLASHF